MSLYYIRGKFMTKTLFKIVFIELVVDWRVTIGEFEFSYLNILIANKQTKLNFLYYINA